MPRKNYVSGFGEKDPDAAQFLKPSNTNQYEASASGVGYNARWDDDAGTSGNNNDFGTDGWQDNSNYMRSAASWTGDADDVHQKLTALIDGQYDQPAGKLLGGGGPVSDNKHGGVGPGKPRFAPKGPGPLNNQRRGGV